MVSSTVKVNSLVLNKYCWMAQQLRNFNDSTSIIQWTNAMLTVKNLFLPQTETYNQDPPALINQHDRNRNHIYAICKQSALSFPPSTKQLRILTPSSTSTFTFQPERPSPLSVCHPQRLFITSASAEPAFKKRKTLSPPQVDCSFQTVPKPSIPNPTLKTTSITKKPPIAKNPRPQFIVWWHENRVPYYQNCETLELTWDDPDQGMTPYPSGNPANKPAPPPNMPEIWRT